MTTECFVLPLDAACIKAVIEAPPKQPVTTVLPFTGNPLLAIYGVGLILYGLGLILSRGFRRKQVAH